MDARRQMVKALEGRFGNLINVARVRVVTVTAVDYALLEATVEFAQGDPLDTPPDPMDEVRWLSSYLPVIGDLAYFITLEGAPFLLGSIDTDAWHNFTLPAGYSAVSPYASPAYRRDGTDRVWMRGAVNIAASNIPATKFILPVGYRPTGNSLWIAVPYSNGTAITGHLRFEINTAGSMTTLAATPAATVIASFEGISFDARG